jgi:hypothetical protein
MTAMNETTRATVSETVYDRVHFMNSLKRVMTKVVKGKRFVPGTMELLNRAREENKLIFSMQTWAFVAALAKYPPAVLDIIKRVCLSFRLPAGKSQVYMSTLAKFGPESQASLFVCLPFCHINFFHLGAKL